MNNSFDVNLPDLLNNVSIRRRNIPTLPKPVLPLKNVVRKPSENLETLRERPDPPLHQKDHVLEKGRARQNSVKKPSSSRPKGPVAPLPLMNIEELKKKFLTALKNCNYNKPIKDMDQASLFRAFDTMKLDPTPSQIQEAFFFAIFSLETMETEGSDPDRNTSSKKKKKRRTLNVSMDQKDKKDATSFHLTKFLKWFQNNYHKIKIKVEIIREPEPKEEEKPQEEAEVKPILRPDQRKAELEKANRNRHYWDLKTRIDQEKNFRAKNVLSSLKEMGLGEKNVGLLNPEHLVSIIQSQVTWADDDKKYCEWGIRKLQEMNVEIKDRLAPIVEEVNHTRPYQQGGANIMKTILESYKKKLESDEEVSKKYAMMAKTRLRQKKLEREMQRTLEMSAILQEQETAIDAARLHHLMCDDARIKELKSYKRSLSHQQERRVRMLMSQY